MDKIKSFKQLKIWQLGIEIVRDIYQITSSFPKEESFGLTSQMRRSAVSIPTNIAEGFKRLHGKEYRQFLHIALGSAAELETLLTISRELNLLSESQLITLTDMTDHVSRMMSSLINKLNYDVRSTLD